MSKWFSGLIALALLAGCAQPVPESNRGIGFGDPLEFELRRAQQEGRLNGVPRSAVPGQTPVISTEELSAAGIGGASGTAAPLSAMRTGGLEASPTNPAPEFTPNASISDEQDFSAVADRETIESDAARREAQAAARQVVEPTALPDRPADAGPNIVEYALNAPNKLGQEWYSRTIFSGQGRFQRNCAAYNSPDAAQRDFLARGGPERDPRGIDPDGDGFACGWDPAPFLLAAGN